MPTIEVLYRLRQQRPDVFDKLEGTSITLSSPLSSTAEYLLVFVDGGIRRGTGSWFLSSHVLMLNTFADVLKALCLGARAVGMGRPFLYAQSVSSILSYLT